MGRDLVVIYEMGQSLVANQNEPYVALVSRSSSAVQLQVIIDIKWSLKWAKIWS